MIVGVGSDIRADDGVGLHVVRELKSRISSVHVDITEVGTAGMGLLDSVRGYERVILVDAIVSGEEPGTVQVLGGSDVARASHLGPGHDADLPTVLALGLRMMGEEMPREVSVVAIEASDVVSVSERLSAAVEAAIPNAVTTVLALCGDSAPT